MAFCWLLQVAAPLKVHLELQAFAKWSGQNGFLPWAGSASRSDSLFLQSLTASFSASRFFSLPAPLERFSTLAPRRSFNSASRQPSAVVYSVSRSPPVLVESKPAAH